MAEVKVQKVANVNDRKLSVFKEMEEMLQRIRDRAFAAFAERGFKLGHALEDWLNAERELCWPEAKLAEDEQQYGLSVALAGYDPKDITVTATPRELIISAKTEAMHKGRSKDKNICWSEFRDNDVYRRVELPADIQVNEVTASMSNGLLQIVAPKIQRASVVIPISDAA
jgi:HSP20 family molecular chaperone IbpA